MVVGTSGFDYGEGDVVLARYGTLDTAVLPRPDLLIGRRGEYVGDDRYNSTARKQTFRVSRSPGRSIPFSIEIQNDGNALDTIVVVSRIFRIRGIDVTFHDDGQPIPPPEISFEGVQKELSVGSSTKIRMVVTIEKGATVGKVYSVFVRGTSMDDGGFSDTVAAKIKVV